LPLIVSQDLRERFVCPRVLNQEHRIDSWLKPDSGWENRGIANGGQYAEIKSGGSVANTAQLREMGSAAMKATGKPLKVITTDPNVKVTQKALQNPNLDIQPLK
jgi:hypothetical protein